jgi:hypothetical protein
LRSLSDSSCVSCRKMADVVRKVYDGGGHVKAGYSRVPVDLTPVRQTDPPVVRVQLQQTEQVRLSANGEVDLRIPAARILAEYHTKREDGKWLVAEITVYV